MWSLKEDKSPNGKQELQVKALLREMAEYSFATNAIEFESSFTQQIEKLPKTNSFSADLMFKVTQRNLKSVEVWKMTVTGEFKYKMFTLIFCNEAQNSSLAGSSVSTGDGIF